MTWMTGCRVNHAEPSGSSNCMHSALELVQSTNKPGPKQDPVFFFRFPLA